MKQTFFIVIAGVLLGFCMFMFLLGSFIGGGFGAALSRQWEYWACVIAICAIFIVPIWIYFFFKKSQ